MIKPTETDGNDGEEESVEEESESETEMVEEIEKEEEIVPGSSYMNAEYEMERMFFECFFCVHNLK